MKNIFYKSGFAAILVFIVLMMPEFSYGSPGMEEIKYLFEKEKGVQWEAASSEEKKAFIRDVQGRKEFQETVEYEGETQKNDEPPKTLGSSILSGEKKEKAPFHIRTAFEQQRGIDWEDAPEQEQESFWEKFVKREENEKAAEEKRLKEEKRRELEIRRQREREEKAIAKKKAQEQKEKEKRLKAEEKKRREEKKKLEKAKKELEKMQKEAERKHK
ncbi:MAG TPA: hypothetical protein PKV41_01830 [Candidatus Omnitrophota bacterium]|nr:hypothetical protein [Candidatus Omnitrophota bacterium]